MFEDLEKREAAGRPIRVAVVGAGGSRGMGVAWQLGRTPGMRLVAAIDVDIDRVQHAAALHGTEWELAASSDAAGRTLRRGRTVVCLIDPAPDNPAA